ncbi:MAG: tRNA (adenosine(37)-N6)-dimethylallyltransferase MiaA [Balneolaceae bacterium]
MRIILLGPTASGKTELSLQIAEELGIPIISVDSRQCYKHVNIGTAKPSEQELQRVKHYNISNLELDEPDSVQAFANRAKLWENEILKDHKHSFFVGGSTLHLQSLIRPMDDMPSANEENQHALSTEIDEQGIEPLYNRLVEVDPAYIKTMDGMNRQRIIRALDVWMQTGKPFSSFHVNKEFELPANTLVFGLHRERQNLYDRINARVDIMISDGLIEETKAILEYGYSKELQPLNAVGYREIISFLEGEMSKEAAIEKIKTLSRRYAKRQLTWFKRWDFIEWLPAQTKKVDELKEILLSRLAAK